MVMVAAAISSFSIPTFRVTETHSPSLITLRPPPSTSHSPSLITLRPPPSTSHSPSLITLRPPPSTSHSPSLITLRPPPSTSHSPSLITLRPPPSTSHAPHSAAKLPMLRTVKTLATVSPPPPPPPPPPPGKTRGIMKPRRVSPEMQALVGLTEVSRTHALKHIWAYIKQNNLQDPENKRVIICDEKLKKVFAGRDEVGMLEIAGLISPHFLK
ncbi:unnamed protein product [Lupinus luteus]|uniref:DM2 domain-containing protein n=1 Tax=Lupinus luteus TaxID=3873 RepID=A0AAV1YDV7_LUPLU